MKSLLFAVLLVGAGCAVGATEPPSAGISAPDFALPSESGKTMKLSEFRGKWVVLYFYPKDFTTGCTIEAHNFQRDLPQFLKHKAEIVGVSMQNSASHKDFCAKEGLHFTLLADTEGKISELYGSVKNFGVAKFSARNTFLIDPKGRIARTFIGVNPSKHSGEVLAALTQLQNAPSR